MALISCENVTMKYDGQTAVDNISFTVDEGDYLCIVGENGSGKSTLIKGLLGLKKPVSGKISYSGIAQNEIGYLPQQTTTQKDFPASVNEVVLSGCLSRCGILPFYSKKDKQRAEDNMTRLEISHINNKSYRELSGGQQQRVLLARALCATEKLLLLDEPVAGLDPVITTELYTLINNLNKSGITVIMVSHDIRSAVQYGSRILHMAMHSAFFGTKEDYLKTRIGRRMMGGSGDV
jgi:zinc transport system ATP-binding protein